MRDCRSKLKNQLDLNGDNSEHLTSLGNIEVKLVNSSIFMLNEQTISIKKTEEEALKSQEKKANS